MLTRSLRASRFAVESDLCAHAQHQTPFTGFRALSSSFTPHLAVCRLVAATPRRPAASTSPTNCNLLDTGERRFAFEFSTVQTRSDLFRFSHVLRSALARSVQETVRLANCSNPAKPRALVFSRMRGVWEGVARRLLLEDAGAEDQVDGWWAIVQQDGR